MPAAVFPSCVPAAVFPSCVLPPRKYKCNYVCPLFVLASIGCVQISALTMRVTSSRIAS